MIGIEHDDREREKAFEEIDRLYPAKVVNPKDATWIQIKTIIYNHLKKSADTKREGEKQNG